MGKIISVFASWQAFLIAFGAFALLGIIRALGTKKDKDGKIIGGFSQSRPFQMFLPLYPYVLAIGIVFIPGVPIPSEMEKTLAVKILFGLWAGWMSGFTFQLAKKVMEKGFGMTFGADKQ